MEFSEKTGIRSAVKMFDNCPNKTSAYLEGLSTPRDPVLEFYNLSENVEADHVLKLVNEVQSDPLLQTLMLILMLMLMWGYSLTLILKLRLMLRLKLGWNLKLKGRWKLRLLLTFFLLS